MKKLAVVFAVVVSGFVNAQNYNDSICGNWRLIRNKTNEYDSVQHLTNYVIHSDILEKLMIIYINVERTKLGLDTLIEQPDSLLYTLDPKTVAKAHAKYMAKSGQLVHSGKNINECITASSMYMYETYAELARTTVDCWMASAAHKHLILNPDSKYIGAGHAHAIIKHNIILWGHKFFDKGDDINFFCVTMQ